MTSPPTAYAHEQTSKPPVKRRNHAQRYTVDDGARCVSDLRKCVGRTPGERQLCLSACSMDKCDLGERPCIRLFGTDGSIQSLMRSLWLMDGVAAPAWFRAPMSFQACTLPRSVIAAMQRHNVPALKVWLDLDDAHLGAVDGQILSLAHWAVLSSCLPALEELIRRCAPFDIRHHRGATPLFVAVISQQEAAMRMLLKAQANPNISDFEGTTPLMAACRCGAVSAVNLLLDAGADPTRRDHAGRNALTVAVEHGRKAVCLIFKQRFRGTPIWSQLREGFETVRPVAHGKAGFFAVEHHGTRSPRRAGSTHPPPRRGA